MEYPVCPKCFRRHYPRFVGSTLGTCDVAMGAGLREKATEALRTQNVGQMLLLTAWFRNDADALAECFRQAKEASL